MSNNFNDSYDEMFAVSEYKRKFKHNGKIIDPGKSGTQKNKFDLKNLNIYDFQTDELIQQANQQDYNSTFLVKLINMYILDVKPFLEHHYDFTENKSKLHDYLKYGIVEQIKHNGKKQLIIDWLNELKPNNLKKSKSIISITIYQLAKIKAFMLEDLKRKEVTVNYLFCEKECSFLDKDRLISYLTETKIENIAFLKQINDFCFEIISFWNNDFQELPDRKFKEPFHSNKIIFSVTDFHAIHLFEDKWQTFNTRLGKIQFTDNYDYTPWQIADIAHRCSLIANWITGAYPESKDIEEINKNAKKIEEIGISNQLTETEELLQSIWLPQARISVSTFLNLGIDKHIWNNSYKIITQKGSMFGTGKTLLGSLAIALKGFTLSQNTDYKETGKVFCKAFHIEINEDTKEPYKSFGNGSANLIRELKREFNIR